MSLCNTWYHQTYSTFDGAHYNCDLLFGRLNEEYQREQDRQEKKRQDDVKAREAKSRRAYEVGLHDAYWLVWVCALL